ncbi:MAG: dUTP diphosphatase [Candidatus Uhrbacteria bacterium]
MNIEVKIKRLDPKLPPLEYKTAGAVAFDLPVREVVTIQPGETKIVRTGYVIVPPEGHAAILVPRSSNAKKLATMANCVGVFDQDFCGPEDEWRIALYNIGTQPYTTQFGERLGQILIVPIAKAQFREVEDHELGPNRGGFGTTGLH